MLNTVLAERFAMVSAIKYANEEIEKAKAVAELKGAALREKETQFQSLSKTVQDLHRSLIELQNSGAISGNSSVSKYIDTLGGLVSNTFIVHIGEPTRILGDFEGSGNDLNRLLSFLRERDAEVELLKTRLIETEKKSISRDFSGVDSERTIASLRAENNALSKQIDQLKTSSSQSVVGAESRAREFELKLKTANSRIQELESQNRSLELQLKNLGGKDSTSSANTSRVDSNLASSQYSSSSSNRYGEVATYGSTSGNEPSYGGIAGTATTTSTYQTSGNRGATGATTGSTTGASTTGAYGSYGSTSGTSGTSGTATGAGYGTLSGSRTGTGATTTTTTATTGSTGATTSAYGSSGAYGTGSGAYGTGSGARVGGATTTTTGTTGATGTSSSTGSSSSAYRTSTYGTSGATGATGTVGATYGSGSLSGSQSGSGSAYGQSASSSISSTGQGVSSSYQRTTQGATGTSGSSSSGLGNSGAGSSGSSYSFQTKRY